MTPMHALYNYAAIQTHNAVNLHPTRAVDSSGILVQVVPEEKQEIE
jgi:hypothetical protein